jgi:hypothetical protein
MGSFNASLRAIGDVTSLKATVELSDDRLSIVAGETEIGTWALDEIRLEEIPTGYRMAAEGEHILIELKDVETFAAELATRTKKRRVFTKTNRSSSESAEPKKRSKTAAASTVPAASGETSTADTPPAPAKARASRESGSGSAQKRPGLVDGILAKTQKRFGPYLPDWMFSRAMLFIVIAAIVTMLLAPGPFSVFLLVAGALLVLFGAVVYSDTVLASKWLPGRATPQQVLLLGLSVLLLGVLLGIVAK